MNKKLGLDLGTNSIGWAIRDTSLDENQFEKYGVNIFKKGVGEGKTGEFSLAAERTKNRSVRRLYQARKYRLWETLGILIIHDYCPLSENDLNKWRKYDKEKGFFRKYPIDATEFEQWIRLDFDNDGISDYTSPYQLRKELIEKKFDISDKTTRYKIGRALYHIAQRRGFKSSRKDKKEDGENSSNKTTELQLSEKKRSSKIEELLSKHKVPTIGAAFAIEETLGNRIRLEWIQYTIRQHYKDEIKKIFEVQGIGQDTLLYNELVESNKNKNDGSIFYKRPLRSQKGLVGICTLEQKTFDDKKTGKTITTGKPRCPISHPDFEEFRAWSFLNNIKYKNNKEDDWQELSLSLKEEIYNEKFFRKSDPYFSFIEVRNFLEKKNYKWILNYKDSTSVSGCPVSARLKSILGKDWKNYRKETTEIRVIKKKNGSIKEHKITYRMEDVWHVLFSFEDEECVGDFAKEKLNLDDEQIKELITTWNKLPDGYSMLSLNAIKKIIPFLRKGLIYTEAVLLANMPTVLGKDIWEKNEENLTNNIIDLIARNRDEKQLLNIVNDLISRWHASDYKVGYKNSGYIIDEKGKQLILETTSKAFGDKTWEQIKEKEKENILNKVTHLYQCFFQTNFEWTYIKDEKYYIIKIEDGTYYKSFGSGYYKIPHLLDYIKKNLRDKLNISDKQLEKLYHPSQIDIYPKAKANKEGKILLQSPKTGSFKNPMAMRTLYELRKLVNYLIAIDIIDEETEVVVEVARELNDANKRWAIETYQRRREEENKEFAIAISELLNDPEAFGRVKADPNSNDDIDKFRLWYEQIEHKRIFKKEPSKNKMDTDGNEIENNDRRKYDWNNIRNEIVQKVIEEKDLIKKYRLWKEQQCRCIYTGNLITVTDLFDENVIDFEHTIPRSISFDNSLANLTVCFADYNRNIKKNRIPTALENYDEEWKGYHAIKPRLDTWAKRIEELKSNIEFWKKKSKQAQDKEAKDTAIRQRHLWQIELEYWENKYSRFIMTEVKTGFKNSQLIDTQLISKYAFHYLKTVFNNVKVQKGSITAEFRKIYGVQPKDEEKNRTRHSHHAIDAAVLTLIPSSAKREEILQKSFEHFESWKLGKLDKKAEKQYHEKPYLHFKVEHLKEIDNNILINNITKDKALIPAKKIERKRGRIIYQRDKSGQIILDENGEKKSITITGDSIRGELHDATFLGAIKEHVRDEKGNPRIGDDGKFIVKEGFSYVVRKPLVYKKDANSPGFKTLNEIIENIVDPHVGAMIAKQVGDKTLKEAIAEGIWMLNKEGDKINKIRHIRVFNRAREPLKIKKQTYLSKYEYKQDYYAANATSYLYAQYKNEIGENDFKILSLFEATEIRKELESEELKVNSTRDFFEETFLKGEKKFQLYAVLNIGQKVIFFNGKKDEFKRISIREEQLKKLYKITEFEKDGRIKFKYHFEARKEDELGTGDSTIDFNKYQPKLRLSKKKLNFLIEGIDFEITLDGTIVFKN